jgi:phage repressor protein C with HTH and peptisase S24 domain/DNA-binding XRE family transcriptional regulator
MFKVRRNMGVGRFIRELRLAKGWTQPQLSEASGVDVGTISAIEQRDSSRSNHFPALAEALDMPLSFLLHAAKKGELPVRWTNGDKILELQATPDGGKKLIATQATDTPSDFNAPMLARGATDLQPSYLAALQPIHAWEFEEDLPPGDYAMVPRLEVKLSAGPGSGATQLSFDFDDGQLRAYSADWIRKNHLKPNKLRVMKGTGRSMEPTIFDGDDLLINLAETEVQDGKVYALWYEGGERVKRLYRMPGGGLRIRSDNDREFPEIVLGPEYTGHVRIIGRVIDRSGPGGL